MRAARCRFSVERCGLAAVANAAAHDLPRHRQQLNRHGCTLGSPAARLRASSRPQHDGQRSATPPTVGAVTRQGLRQSGHQHARSSGPSTQAVCPVSVGVGQAGYDAIGTYIPRRPSAFQRHGAPRRRVRRPVHRQRRVVTTNGSRRPAASCSRCRSRCPRRRPRSGTGAGAARAARCAARPHLLRSKYPHGARARGGDRVDRRDLRRS